MFSTKNRRLLEFGAVSSVKIIEIVSVNNIHYYGSIEEIFRDCRAGPK
jgi:hypothetical protein